MPAEPNSSLPPDDRDRRRAGFNRQFAMAMELPFILVGCVVLGGLTGFALDNWLGTRPFLLVVFGMFGLFAGVREMMRRLNHGRGGKEPGGK